MVFKVQNSVEAKVFIWREGLYVLDSLFMVISWDVDACSYYLVLSYFYYVFIMCTEIFINVMYNLRDNFFLLSLIAHFYAYLYIL